MKNSIREYRPKSSVLSKDSLMSKDGVEADLVNLRKVVVKSENVVRQQYTYLNDDK